LQIYRKHPLLATSEILHHKCVHNSGGVGKTENGPQAKTQRKRKRGGRAVGGKEAAIAGRKRNSKGEKYNEKVECTDHRDQGMKM
jgi:hypothetical protein